MAAAGIGIAFATMSSGSTTISSGSVDEVRTIKHAMGETEIAGKPERSVVMDIVALETFLHLGIQPVGLSSLDTQKSWNPEIATEWPDVVDVGNTYEPNFEVIAQLEPDVIFASESEHSEMYDELAAIAPTIMLNNWPYQDGPTMLQAVEQNIMTISDVMERSDDGATYLDEFHRRIQEHRERIDSAGLAGSRFILANAVAFEGQPGLFLFVPSSQNSEILERIGLENAVSTPEEFARYGHTEVSLEALATLDGPDVHFIYVTSPGGGDPIADPEHLRDHPVWNNLSFVKEGRVYHIGQINMFRGPMELEKVAESIIDALTSGSEVRKIKHTMGETEITGIPKRIVALSWPLGANLLTLGIKPIGMGNADTFNEIVNLDEVVLPADVANVGAPWEPNLEAIAELEPDLIVGATHDNELIYEDLSAIAPTLLFDVFVEQPGQDGPNELELMEQNFMTMADVVGKHDEGTTIIDSMHAKFDAAAAKLEDERLGEEKFVLAYVQSDATTMWIWIDALNTQLLERAGLENAYKTAYEAEYQYDYDFGGVAWGLEGLAIVDDPSVHLIFRQHTTDAGIPDAWEGNPVWEGLAFVESGHVYPHESLYVYAGPRAAEVFVDTVVEMLTSS